LQADRHPAAQLCPGVADQVLDHPAHEVRAPANPDADVAHLGGRELGVAQQFAGGGH
jgi:hypothetical protein